MSDVFDDQAEAHRRLLLDEAVHAARALGLADAADPTLPGANAPTGAAARLTPHRLALLIDALRLDGHVRDGRVGPLPPPPGPPLFALAEALATCGREVPPTPAYYDYLRARGAAPAAALAALLPSARRVLDAGAGAGTYGRAYRAAHPGARLTYLDQADALAAAGLVPEHDEQLQVGDLLRDPLGGPYDLVLLANVVHLLPLGALPGLFTRLRAALAPDGLLVVKDLRAEPDSAVAVLFNLSLVTFTRGDGMPRPEHVTAQLQEAGLVVTQRELPGSPSSAVWLAQRGTEAPSR